MTITSYAVRRPPATMWARATVAFCVPVAVICLVALVIGVSPPGLVSASVGIPLALVVLVVAAVFIDKKVIPWIAKGT